VLFAIAQQIGPEGAVTGIDLAVPMVEATAAEVEHRGLSNVRVQAMDAEQLDFPSATFDAVLCGFGLMFFPELDRAMAEFRRVLRPNGVMAATTWGEGDPRWNWYRQLQVSYHLAQTSERMMSTRLNKQADLEAALNRAGFHQVKAWTEEIERFYETGEDWWAEIWSEAQRAALEPLDSDDLERFKAVALEQLGQNREPRGFPRRWQAVFGLGRNP
jgi:ubiquinone/menaquinone biosynthesis C-methylase UbiE